MRNSRRAYRDLLWLILLLVLGIWSEWNGGEFEDGELNETGRRRDDVDVLLAPAAMLPVCLAVRLCYFSRLGTSRALATSDKLSTSLG